MPRGKRAGGARGSSSRGSRGGRGTPSSVQSSFIPFKSTTTGKGGYNGEISEVMLVIWRTNTDLSSIPGYSLQEEARNTESHTFWDSDQKLRHSKVSFISAAEVATPDSISNEPSNEAALAVMTLNPPPSEDLNIEVPVTVGKESEFTARDLPTSVPGDLNQSIFTGFMIDTVGGKPVNTRLPPPKLRSSSPTPSDSSEEVILFTGRKNQSQSKPDPPVRTITDPIEAKIRIVDKMIYEQEELLQETLRQSDSGASETVGVASPKKLNSAFEAILPKRRGKGKHRSLSDRKSIKQKENDALVADYLQNIDDNDLVGNVSFNQRELGGVNRTGWEDETEPSSAEDFFASKQTLQGEWDRTDIQDFDDFSTSDGVMGEVHAIYSKRERKSGIQYLVVWENQTVDEARWVPSSTLTSFIALSHIDNFEAEEELITEFQDNSEGESTESEDIDDADHNSEDDEEEDEQDLGQRKRDRMADEQIARLLAKQEELGMGGDELLLFDDAADAAEDDIFTVPKNNLTPLAFSSGRSRAKGAKRPRGDFPAASALGSAYDGFDVMDFERPSLKKKPKGRKGKVVFDLSDSELEASMQMAWDNDRVKKKERKQEREQLRSQGLLGSKNGKPDLKEKYKEGMGLPAIKDEIRSFLMGGNTT
jgi:hypothetical protein